MESHRYSLSSLIHGLDSDLHIGVHFHPTHADGISIVNIKNKGGQHLICKEADDLFQRPPEQLEECFCFTKLELLGNKVKRQLSHSSGSWKNQNAEKVVVNNVVIGCVTKLKLHTDKKRPTEWHILEYMDTEKADADRYVLCRIYKTGNNKYSGSSSFLDPNIDNTTVLPHVASDVGAGQISSSTSQVSSMWANGAGGEMNQVQHCEIGQCSYTPPYCSFNAEPYLYLPGEHMNQDQIYGVAQSGIPPPDDMVYNSQQFTSNNTYSIGGIDDMGPYQCSDLDTFSDFDMDDYE